MCEDCEDHLSPVPFITFLVKAILWTVYDMMKSDVSLMLSNCCCALLPFLYIIHLYIIHLCVLQLHHQKESHAQTLFGRPVGAVFSSDLHRCDGVE